MHMSMLSLCVYYNLYDIGREKAGNNLSLKNEQGMSRIK